MKPAAMGTSETWTDVDDLSAGDGSTDDVWQSIPLRTNSSNYNYSFNYDFDANTSAISSTAAYGSPLPTDGTMGTRHDSGSSTSSSQDLIAGIETRTFHSKSHDAGPTSAPAPKTPDEIVPRDTEVTLNSGHQFLTSTTDQNNFDQTFAVSATGAQVSLLADGSGSDQESIASGQKTEITTEDAGVFGTTNFVKNSDTRVTNYWSNSEDNWTSHDGDPVTSTAIVSSYDATGQLLGRDGVDERVDRGGGESHEFGTFSWDHEWKLYDGDRQDHYHEIGGNGTFNEDSLGAEISTDGVFNHFASTSPYYNSADPNEGYYYKTSGSYSLAGGAQINEINRSETDTHTHDWQTVTIDSDYQIGGIAPFTYSKEHKQQDDSGNRDVVDEVDDNFTTMTSPTGSVSKTGYTWTKQKSQGQSDELVYNQTWDRQEVKSVDGGQSVWHQQGSGGGDSHTTEDGFPDNYRNIQTTFGTATGTDVWTDEKTKLRSHSSSSGNSAFTYDFTKGDISTFDGMTEHEQGNDHFVRASGDSTTENIDDDTVNVTVFGSDGPAPDEQGSRTRHWKTKDTHTDWGTGTYTDQKKAIVNGRHVQNDDQGNLSWNDDPSVDSDYENSEETDETVTETLLPLLAATIVTDRKSKSYDKEYYERTNGSYSGSAYEGDVTLPGSPSSVGDNGYFSQEGESYTQTDDSKATTDFAVLLTDSVDPAGVLTTTGTDTRKWESWVTSDRSGSGTWDSTHNQKLTPAVATSARDSGSYTFLRHTFAHDHPTETVTYNPGGLVTDNAYDTGNADSHDQFVIPDGWYSYTTTSSTTSTSETGPYEDNSDSYTQSNYTNNVTTTYSANSPTRQLSGTKESKLWTWGNGTYTAGLNKTVDNTNATDTGTRDYQTFLHNVFNVNTSVTTAGTPTQTTETHTVLDNGTADGYARSNLNGTLTYQWSNGIGSADSTGFNSSNVYVDASDENYNSSWNDNYTTVFTTDGNGATTASTSGQIDDIGDTWGTNTRTNHDTVSVSRAKSDSGTDQTSSETYTRLDDLIVDYDHQHNNQTSVSNNEVTSVNAHEYGTNKVQRKNGKINIGTMATWKQGDVTLGNGIDYLHSKNYDDYEYATTKSDYDNTTTTTYPNGQPSQYSGTFKILNGTLDSGTVKSGTEAMSDQIAVTNGADTVAQSLASNMTFTDSTFQNLSTFSQLLTLNPNGSSTNTQFEQGTSGTSQSYYETGLGTSSTSTGNLSAGNGSTSSGTDAYSVTSNNGSSYSSTLNMTSTYAGGQTTVDGSVQSNGGGSGLWLASYNTASDFHSASNDPGVSKTQMDGTAERNLTSNLSYNFTSGWSLTRNSSTGTTTFSRNDGGFADTNDAVVQSSFFNDETWDGDLSALNHVYRHKHFTRDTSDNDSRTLHYDYTSGSTQTDSNGTQTIVGTFADNSLDQVNTAETVHEHLRTDDDDLVNGTPSLGGSFSDHETAWYESDWTDSKNEAWNASGNRNVSRLADGTIQTSNNSGGSVTKQGTHVLTASWYDSDGDPTSGGQNESSSYGPDTTSVSAVPGDWYGLPRNYYSGGVFFPGEPSGRHVDGFGKMVGAENRTKTYSTLFEWAMPSLDTYYAHPGVVAKDLPVRALINGHAEETGGPQWASERDGSELVRNVEHIRGLVEADASEALLTKPICEPPTNSWSTYGQLVVWQSRVIVATPGVAELSTHVDVTVPASEMQGFAETLRRHYQSEETAQKLEARDRSLSMPPRTVADANAQLNGWMAEFALTGGRLELNDDTMRRADSGKFDDGGTAETKQLGEAYKSDPPPEAPVNKPVAAQGANGGLADAFQKRFDQLQQQFARGELSEPFKKGLWEGLYEDGLKQSAKALMELPGDAWSAVKGIPRAFKAVKDAAQTAAFWAVYATFYHKSYDRDVRERVDELYQQKIEPLQDLIREFQKLSMSELLLIFQGKADQLEGKLSDDAMLIAMTVGQEVGDIVDQLTNDPTLGPKGAEVAGRIIGMVLYNAAEASALSAITAGAANALAAQKAQKIIGRIEQVAKGTLKKFPRVEKSIEQAFLLWDKVRKSHMCFVAGTPVHTLQGLKKIEDVRVGDLVLTRPENWSGGAVSPEYKPVLQTFVTHPTELLHITVESDSGERETLVGTGPHPFYVERTRAFVPASDLKVGDRLSLPEGRSASVIAIRHERAAAGSAFTTYNFEVADHHTYFVGKAGVWVHNVGTTPCQFAEAKFQKALVKHGGDALKAADDSFDFLKKYVRRKGMSDEVLMRHLNDVVREINEKHGVPMPDLIRMRHRKLGIGNTQGPPEWDIDVFSNKFSWRKYLQETSGSKQDFLGETWETAELKYGKDKIHTHHIAMKKGLGEAGKAAVDRTREMLINLGIDPIFDRANLAFLPKGGHPDDYAIAVEKAIKEVVDNGQGRDAAVEALCRIARDWARKKNWKVAN